MSTGREWNECPAHARKKFPDGKERTIICDLPLHAAPEDETAQHWDAELAVYWMYANGADYEDEE